MNRKIIIGILLIALIGSIGAVMADNGTFKTNGTVVLTENGTNVNYDSICVDKDRSISNNQKVSTRDNITVREGLMETFLESWTSNMNSTELSDFQNKIWNVSENTSLGYVTYDDYYSVNRTINTTPIVTIEEINGSNYTVTRYISSIDEFIFRMVGDGWSTGIQDLLIWLVNSYDSDIVNYELIEIDEPPINETNTTINKTIVKEANVTINESITNEITVINNNTDGGIICPDINITLEEMEFCNIEPKPPVKDNTLVNMKNTGNNLIILALAIMGIVGILVIVRKR